MSALHLFHSGAGEPGEVYGGYRLLELVSQGRISRLYRGENVQSGEVVAVKVLTDYGCKVARKLQHKLKKDWEGERARKLKHPNIVRTITCGRHRGRYYIVMEFLSGGNLLSLLRSHSPAIEGRKVEIMRQAAAGLEYVHRCGVIHRDVCPRNIMLAADGTAKLIDFGVAANRGDRIRDVGQRTGTPAYMAPELVRTNHFDELTDIYAFGVSLYEVATGQRPIKFTDDNPQAIAAAILNATITPPRQLRPSISQPLERVIVRAMDRRRHVRYPSMTRLLEDLATVSDDDL